MGVEERLKGENGKMKSDLEQTEIEASYELPEGWKWISIGECCEKAFSGKSPKYSKEETPYKIIGQQANQRYGIDLKFVKFGTQEYAEAQADFYYLQYNDVILNTLGTGSIGRSGIYKYHEKILTDGHPFVFRTGTKYSPDLLFYYFRLNEQEIINTANGSTNQKFLSLKTFSKFPIPLPPTLAEQQRIVKRIESMFSKLDEAKEKAQNVVDSFETRKAAILHKAFTGELTAKWRKENGVSDDSWVEKTIGEICLVKGGKRVPKGMSLIKEKNEHPYLKAGNLKFGTVIDKDMEYVPNDVFILIKNYTVNAGDVYITNVGACIGDCGIIPDYYHGANLTENAVKLTEMICNNSYLAKQLSSNLVQTQIKSKIKSATLGKLSIDNIKQLKINLPTLTEQVEIVRILDIIIEKENKAKQAAEAVLEQIDLLKKSILARAFRGEL